MKSKNLILSAMLTVLPSMTMAQQNIQKTFDALLNDNIKEINTQHSLERNPETGKKEAQADVYDLMITDPAVMHHIKDIQKAFEKENDKAYEFRNVNHAGTNYMSLAVGDGRKQSVAIGKMKGSDYIYACFLDKDDPEKKYRYAYAMEWVEKDKRTHVRLAVTYATTMKYREGRVMKTTININGEAFDILNDIGSGFVFTDSVSTQREDSSDKWLSKFNTYRRLFLNHPDGVVANDFATRIYKLCKNSGVLDDEEKYFVGKELERMKGKTKDEFIQGMFDMSIKHLKK